MAFFKVALIAALVVAAFAEPIRHKRQVSEIIATSGAAAAAGDGSSSDDHAAAIVVLGIPASQGGWGQDVSGAVPASIIISNAGISEVSNEAAILEVTSNDGEGNLAGLQTIGVSQLAGAQDGLDVEASGGEIALGSNSEAAAEGAGASASAANLEILSNPASLGLAHQ